MARMKKLPQILNEEEISAILNQFNVRYAGPRRNKLMIRVALTSGMRISELTSLRFEDMRLLGSAYRIHIKEAKGGKDRMTWIPAELGAELGEMAKREGRVAQGRVFVTRRGGEIDHGYLRRMIKDRGSSAGVNRLHFHLLRHTALTNLYRVTKDLRVVQETAGHKDPKTTAIYAHVSGEDIKDGLETSWRSSPTCQHR